MKKNQLFMLSAALMALTSCSNSDVLDVPEMKKAEIQFAPFVNKNTRAVTEVDNKSLKEYFVFGAYGTQANSYETTAFSNVSSTTTQYWEYDKQYCFAAYADGTGGQLTTTSAVNFTPGQKKLEFLGYTPNDAKDLIAVVTGNITGPTTGVTTAQEVGLSFKHMLAQVGFTFVSTDPEAYVINITSVKITDAINKSNGTYTVGGANPITWSETGITPTSKGYTYNELAIADLTENGKWSTLNNRYEATQSKLVIPQASTNNLTVEIKVEFKENGQAQAQQKTLTANLAYTGTGLVEGTTANTWTPGYRYMYTAELNRGIIMGLLPIVFKPTVEAWKDASSVVSKPAAQK